MKKVYDYEQFFYIKGQTKDFQPTSIWRHLRLLSADEVMAKEGRFCFQDFDKLWEFIENGGVRNATVERTLFGNRRVVFKDGLDYYTVKEKRFQEVTIWYHCMECPSLSLKTLMENLTAEEMVEYFKERGIEWGK